MQKPYLVEFRMSGEDLWKKTKELDDHSIDDFSKNKELKKYLKDFARIAGHGMSEKRLREAQTDMRKIKEALEALKETYDFLDKQKLEWNMETESIPLEVANTYFEAIKAELEKVKRILEY